MKIARLLGSTLEDKPITHENVARDHLLHGSYWETTTRSQIVEKNIPLVLAMAKRTRLVGVDFNEMISEGNMALLRSVDKFDCSRGFQIQYVFLPGDPEKFLPRGPENQSLSRDFPGRIRSFDRKKRPHGTQT